MSSNATMTPLEEAAAEFEDWFMRTMESTGLSSTQDFPLDIMQNITNVLANQLEQSPEVDEDGAFFLDIRRLLQQYGGGEFRYRCPIQKVILLPVDYDKGNEDVQEFFERKKLDQWPNDSATLAAEYVNRFPEMKFLMTVLSNAWLLLLPSSRYGHLQSWLEYELDARPARGGAKRLVDNRGNDFPGFGQEILPLLIQKVVKYCRGNQRRVLKILATCAEYFDIISVVEAAGLAFKDGKLQEDLVDKLGGTQGGYGIFLDQAMNQRTFRGLPSNEAQQQIASAVAEGKVGDFEDILKSLNKAYTTGDEQDKEIAMDWISQLLYLSMSMDAKYRPAVEGPLTHAILQRFKLKPFVDGLIGTAVYNGNLAVLNLIQSYGFKVPQLRIGEENLSVMELAGSMPVVGNVDRAPIVRSMLKGGSLLPPLRNVLAWQDVNLVQMVQELFRAPSDE